MEPGQLSVLQEPESSHQSQTATVLFAQSTSMTPHPQSQSQIVVPGRAAGPAGWNATDAAAAAGHAAAATGHAAAAAGHAAAATRDAAAATRDAAGDAAAAAEIATHAPRGRDAARAAGESPAATGHAARGSAAGVRRRRAIGTPVEEAAGSGLGSGARRRKRRDDEGARTKLPNVQVMPLAVGRAS